MQLYHYIDIALVSLYAVFLYHHSVRIRATVRKGAWTWRQGCFLYAITVINYHDLSRFYKLIMPVTGLILTAMVGVGLYATVVVVTLAWTLSLLSIQLFYKDCLKMTK